MPIPNRETPRSTVPAREWTFSSACVRYPLGAHWYNVEGGDLYAVEVSKGKRERAIYK